jgi:hypothetical protein
VGLSSESCAKFKFHPNCEKGDWKLKNVMWDCRRLKCTRGCSLVEHERAANNTPTLQIGANNSAKINNYTRRL